jgi:hypothetical protein
MMEIFQDDESLMYEYLRPAEVRKLYQQHITGENDNHKVLFSLIMLEHWLRAQTFTVAPSRGEIPPVWLSRKGVAAGMTEVNN